MKKILIVLGICLIIIGLADFSFAASKLPNPGPKDKYFIFFAQRSMNHPWLVTLQKSFENAVKKYKNRISRYKWSDGENDAANQLNDIQDATKLKPDMIITTPIVTEALTPAAAICRKAGVPLIVIDRKINAVPGKDYVCWIGSSYREQGRAVAKELVAKLHRKYGEYKGNVVEITGTAGSSPQIDRGAGFRDIIDKYPKIKIVASQDGDYLRDKAMGIMENYLERFPKGSIDAVYDHSDEMAIGIVQAIERAGRNELLGWIVSTDGQKLAIKYVIDGKMLATAQTPPYFGDLAIKTAIDYLDGKKIESEIWLPLETFSNRTPKQLDAAKDYYEYLVENKLEY